MQPRVGAPGGGQVDPVGGLLDRLLRFEEIIPFAPIAPFHLLLNWHP